MSEAYICEAVRTPIGRYGGSLSAIRTDDLAALPLKALMARNPKMDWQAIDDVILGCVNQAGEDNRNVARMASLLAGLPVTVSGATVNRLCGSGLDALASASRALKLGEANLMIAGGVEGMSRSPFVMPKADSAFSRQASIEDTTMGWRFVNKQMKAMYGIDSMPVTAENVAEAFQISRQDQDAFAYRSQMRTKAAQESGRLAKEIVGVDLPAKKGELQRFEQDEHPRGDTNLEKLAKLPTPFREGGTVTAGNASGVNDGAAAILVASEEGAKRHGLKPIARVVGAATAGVEPRIMGFGPAPATRKLLDRLGLKMSQIDVVELNEAFAAQVLAVTRDLGLADDDPKINPNGGAIALGHPLGMSGARLAGTAALELQERRGRYALCTMCIGVGQGIALVLERV